MRPPVLAQALIAAAAPSGEYDVVAGDLHEEYLHLARRHGVKAANRWYWAQTLRSIPPLLSYFRSNGPASRRAGVALISLAVLAAMLVAITAVESAVQRLFDVHRIPEYAWICFDYAGAGAFGALLARLVRVDGLRVVFLAALFLVLCFVVPALAGNPHSQAPLAAWAVLLGVIPAMCFGAGCYQAVSRGVTYARFSRPERKLG